MKQEQPRLCMQQEHLEKLISTDYKLIALETDSPEQSINDFRPFVRESKAIYLWDHSSGLRRMEASHISIPKTRTPEMVINHIHQSKHYGVYLLMGFGKELGQKQFLPLLKQIIAEHDSNKTIIFIDSHFNYPYNLMSDILITQEPNVRARELLNQSA